jgi:hypothetical protein
MRARLSVLVFVAFMWAAPCADALKQPLGPEFNISNPSTTSAGAASAAADSQTGRYFVVWTKNLEPGVLKGRLIDRDGRALTEEIGITEQLWFLSYLSPVVTYNAGLREYLVVWTWFTCCPYREEIRAQRVSAAGEKIGAVITVWSGYSSGQPAAACSSRSGECLVAWASRNVLGQPPEESGARARLIGAGATAGPEVLLDSRGVSTAAVGYAPEADRYLVAWDAGAGVSGRILDSTASAIGGGPFEIALPGSQAPVVAYNAPDREFGVLFGQGFSYVAGARVAQDGNVEPAGILSRGKIDGASLAFDARERSYLAAWGRADEGQRVGAFLSPNLSPIAPADFAGGYQVTYNPAADEYLLVKASCSLPGLLVSVCGRRVGTPPPGAAADRTGPRLQLTVRRLQRIVRQRGLVLRARCDEACTVRASARITLPGASRSVALRRVTRPLAPDVKTKLRLKTSKRTLRTLRHALERRHRLGARLTMTATDSAGNRTIAKRKLRARR